MSLPEVVVGDIATLDVDAIVNAANRTLAPGGGVCGAIHRAAGPELAGACTQVGPCDTGDARITGGFKLRARFVIHTVGPIYGIDSRVEAEQLRSCYRQSIELAEREALRSIAFPCISTGVFGYPLEPAAEIALSTMLSWLRAGRSPSRIVCCCFAESDAEVYRNTLTALTA